MSKTGLTLGALYGAVMLGCVGYSMLGGLDDKSRFIFFQIPIARQSALAVRLGWAEFLQHVNWTTAYLIFAGPVFVLLYLLGLLCDVVRKPARTKQR